MWHDWSVYGMCIIWMMNYWCCMDNWGSMMYNIWTVINRCRYQWCWIWMEMYSTLFFCWSFRIRGRFVISQFLRCSSTDCRYKDRNQHNSTLWERKNHKNKQTDWYIVWKKKIYKYSSPIQHVCKKTKKTTTTMHLQRVSCFKNLINFGTY